MKCYCTNCYIEKEMCVVKTSINKRATEKKIKGYCRTCSAPMCFIVAINNKE